MKNTLVSVVTPVFKGKSTLLTAMSSLQEQTHDNWECLLVSDDGFDYLNWLKKQGFNDERVRFFHSPHVGSGPNMARNLAKKHAAGEWLAPLDADDLYYPNRLSALLDAADETGLAVDNVKVVNDGERVISYGFSKVSNYLSIDHFFHNNTPFLMLFHQQVANHDWETLPRGGDTIFNLRALEKAGKCRFLEDVLHEYYVHPDSMCHSQDVGDTFHRAYNITLNRLNSDGLGFQTDIYRETVKRLIKHKQVLNNQFEHALKNGFSGDFQSFVSEFVEHTPWCAHS